MSKPATSARRQIPSIVNFIAQVAHVVLPSTFVLYATYRYGWDSKTVGLTLAMVGICAMVV